MAQPLDIFLRMDVFQKIGAPAHNQPRRLIRSGSAPDRQPLGNQFLRQLVEFLPRFFRQFFQFRLGFGKRVAVNMRVEKIRCLDQLRIADADGQIDHAVFDIAVLHDQNRKRPGRLETNEFDMFQRAFRLGGKHEARAARQA